MMEEHTPTTPTPEEAEAALAREEEARNKEAEATEVAEEGKYDGGPIPRRETRDED